MIHAEKATYPIVWMCGLLKVGRSSYYDWVARAGTLSATAARRAELGVKVKAVFEEYRQTYGCRRIARELNAAGVSCSVGLVADLMREQGLVAVQPRAYKVTTVPGEDHEAMPPDLIGRDFTAETPGQRLVGDITYLRTDQGWLYLATVIDLCTRMVVGWQMAEHMRTSLVVDALDMARVHGHLGAGAVFHSDRGTQGGFNGRRNTLMTEVCGGEFEEAVAGASVGRTAAVGSGSCVAAGDAIAGAAGAVTRGAARVLAVNR